MDRGLAEAIRGTKNGGDTDVLVLRLGKQSALSGRPIDTPFHGRCSLPGRLVTPDWRYPCTTESPLHSLGSPSSSAAPPWPMPRTSSGHPGSPSSRRSIHSTRTRAERCCWCTPPCARDGPPSPTCRAAPRGWCEAFGAACHSASMSPRSPMSMPTVASGPPKPRGSFASPCCATPRRSSPWMARGTSRPPGCRRALATGWRYRALSARRRLIPRSRSPRAERERAGVTPTPRAMARMLVTANDVPVSGAADDVRRAQQGDVDAFERLYHAHAPAVHALARRMLGDDGAAREMVQDVFVRAWERLGSFRGESAFGTWLHRVGVNLILNELRVARRDVARFVDDEGDETLPPAGTTESGVEA